MNIPKSVREGFIPFRDYHVWYRVVGDQEEPGRVPLLCLHGGPGFPHDYLEPLESIAAAGRRVIFYDQLGCGNSDEPLDPSLYTVDLYVEEIGVVRGALGLARVHILGHSWGGQLAMEYALTQAPGLASLILADTAASIPQWVTEMRRLVGELPPEVQQAILEHEAAGTTDSPEYQEAVRAFYRRHAGGRIDPRPEFFTRMADKPGDKVYRAMWGPSEFYLTGTLKHWDITGRLGEIHVPTLVLGGRHDHATPVLAETMRRGIHNSELVIFENSGHFPHIEETVHFLQVLDDFLHHVEVHA